MFVRQLLFSLYSIILLLVFKLEVLNDSNARCRFLISFSGQYLAYDICVSSPSCEEGDTYSTDHQLLKIYVPQIDTALSGPAFVEASITFKICILSPFCSKLLSFPPFCTTLLP